MSLPEIPLQRLDGTPENLADYRGKVLLVVNVASGCGFTPQYEGLEALYRKHRDQGLAVMGFPCDQFGGQEPGTEEEIATFCATRFAVSFPMFRKCDVNGPDTHPFYAFLKAAAPGILGTESVKWNFTKFLVDRDGRVRKRYASADPVDKIAAELDSYL